MVLGLENYNFQKTALNFEEFFSYKIKQFQKEIAFQNFKYYFICISVIILFIVILIMFYELVPYLKKLIKNINQH